MENIIVNPGNKTVTWAAPAEPNGIIVGYRVQYWELGRRDTSEEVNTTTAEDLVYSYSTFSKCSIAILTVQYNSIMIVIAHPTGAGVPHKVQVQAATVAGLGKSRAVEEVLFSEEQGTVYF